MKQQSTSQTYQSRTSQSHNKGKLDVLSAFIKIRPNAVNQAGQDGVAPLLAAINRAYKYLYFQSQNKFEDINAAVLALIEAGAFIYQADHKDGTTPLLAAINVIISRKPNHHCDYAYRDDKRMEKIVLNLLDAGADPNQSDIHGTTPLMKAREYGIDVLLNPTANQITWDKLQVITAKIKQKTSVIPQIGIICGSGFSGLADELDTDKAIDKIPYKEIGLPKCSVEGHAGRLVFGYLAGQPVVCMQGRYHFYEGHLLAWQVTKPVLLMKQLGVKVLIVTNAAGGLNEGFAVGDIMIIKDHINLAGMTGHINPLIGPNIDQVGPRFPPMTSAYDKELRDLAAGVAKDLDISDCVKSGVYICVSGPNYETPSDSIFLKTVGADAVGMSTVPEVIVARHAGIRVLGFSLITNLAILEIDSTKPPPNHDEVKETARKRSEDLQKLVKEVVVKMKI